MRIAHVLRKYNPLEWGGTETAVQRLVDGLAAHRVRSVLFAPEPSGPAAPPRDPIHEAVHELKRYKAFVPVARISTEQKRQLISVGGNLMSFDLLAKLFREADVSLIHTHAVNRIGGIGLTVARARRLPFVVTIHGGVLDLPASVRDELHKPLRGGLEWGKVFGPLLRSRHVLAKADAIITCNEKEAALARSAYPGKPVLRQPHGVPSELYQRDNRAAAREAFPALNGRKVLVAVGRIDPVKNQLWLIQQLPRVLIRHPDVLLAMAGACTDETYGKAIKKEIRKLGLEEHVLLTGGLPPGDSRLIGLLQESVALVLPSLFETFGLVVLEAWAAGRPVLSTRTSGALGLVREGENGSFFDLGEPDGFHRAVETLFTRPELASALGGAGRELVAGQFDSRVLAGRIHQLYGQLIENSNALRHSSRR